MARTTATTLLLPLVVVKTKIEFGTHNNMISATRDIYRNNGLKGFWKGLAPTIARDGSYSALFFVFYREIQSITGKLLFHDFQLCLIIQIIFNFRCESKLRLWCKLYVCPKCRRCGYIFDSTNGCFPMPPSNWSQRRIIQLPRSSSWTGYSSGVIPRYLLKKNRIIIWLLDGLAPRITRRSLVSAINWSVFEAAKNYYQNAKIWLLQAPYSAHFWPELKLDRFQNVD